MAEDDPALLENDRLLRRVHPSQLVTDADGSKRPSSAVFKDPELSVNIESLMIRQGRLPEETLAGFPGWRLTSIRVEDVRRYDRERGERHPIVLDTTPPNDPSHGLILGKKTGAFANAMVRNHEWIVAPT